MRCGRPAMRRRCVPMTQGEAAAPAADDDGAADDADGEDADDVEADEAVKDEPGDSRHGAPRVLDLARYEGNHVRPGNGEARIEDHLPEAEEATEVDGGVVRAHGVAASPVAEVVGVAVRVAADHGDKGQQHQADQQQDLERRHDELGLAVPRDGDDVERDAHGHGHDDPDGRVDARGPVLHHRRDAAVVDADEHDAGVEIRPPHGEAERGVDEARRQLKDAAADGQVRVHLGDAQVDGPHVERGRATAARPWRGRRRCRQRGRCRTEPPMAMSCTCRGERPHRVCPYERSSCVVAEWAGFSGAAMLPPSSGPAPAPRAYPMSGFISVSLPRWCRMATSEMGRRRKSVSCTGVKAGFICMRGRSWPVRQMRRAATRLQFSRYSLFPQMIDRRVAGDDPCKMRRRADSTFTSLARKRAQAGGLHMSSYRRAITAMNLSARDPSF